MKLNEVQETYFEYQEKHRVYILEIQNFFIKNGFNPYVWLDDIHQLHVKIKLQRNIQDIDSKAAEINSLSEELSEKEGISLIWREQITYEDMKLPEQIRKQTTIELVYKNFQEE